MNDYKPIKPWTIVLMISTLSVCLLFVYVKYRARALYSENKSLETEAQHLKTEESKLLLELGTLTSPARMKRLAQEKFGLHAPRVQDVVIVREQSDAQH